MANVSLSHVVFNRLLNFMSHSLKIDKYKFTMTVDKAPTEVLPSSESYIDLKEDNNKQHSLYVRLCHQKPSRDELLKLHPNVIDVRLPRQKSAKFFKLEFENKEAAAAASKDLKKKYGKEIKIQPVKHFVKKTNPVSITTKPSEPTVTNQNEDASAEESAALPEEDIVNNKSFNCVFVSGLPTLSTKEVLESLFSTHTTIDILKKKTNEKCSAYVYFESAEEATEAVKSSVGVSVNGEALTIKFHQGNANK